MKDTISERDRLQSAVYRLEGEVREEEKEAQKRGDDVDRLRNDRNEWRYWYDEAMTWNPEGEEENAEEIGEARTEGSVAGSTGSDGVKLKITRKEADKVVIPNWPKIHELEFWKSQETSNLVAASGASCMTLGRHGSHQRSQRRPTLTVHFQILETFVSIPLM